jgi:RNA polymerase sigma factor for flagellar operon FliA
MTARRDRADAAAMTTPSGETLHRRDALARRVWERYRATGDVRERNRLVTMHASLVQHIAYEKARELPPRCDVDDLVSAGFIGLIQAIERWDPTRGVGLVSFAWSRIHGAIVDELRVHDWAPRRLRRRERQLFAARETVNRRLGRTPTDDDLAQELGLTAERVAQTRHDLLRADVESLNIAPPALPGVDAGGAPEERVEQLVDALGLDPADAVARRELGDRLLAAVGTLSERDRTLTWLLYVEEISQVDAAKILGVTQSRVSQLHAKLRDRLRLLLSEHRDSFEAVA